MTDTEKKLAFLLATSPYLDTLDGAYEKAAMDLAANGVVPVVRCKECKHGEIDDPDFPDQYYCREGCGWNKCDFWCASGERRADNGN